MSDAWIAVIVVGIATFAIKAAGPVAIGGRELPQRLLDLVGGLAPALLAALVATQTLGGDRQLVVDERLLGVAAAGALIMLRAPVLVVLIAAAAVTAIARQF